MSLRMIGAFFAAVTASLTQLAMDFQRSNALGRNVRSSAAGVVGTRRDLGNTSYGKYLVIRHAEGW